MGLKTILIVEDDPDIRETLQLALQIEGYHVLSAVNGKEGLNILRGSGPVPSLILLDLMMPVMNGLEFLAISQRDSELAKIPVVVVSAFYEMKRDLESKNLVTQGFIKKPVDFTQLMDSVQRFCGKAPRPGQS